MAVSAGLLMFRRGPSAPEVLLVHPGGPFFARKDAGSWSIPKGLVGEGEDPLAAARREFAEETSFPVTAERFLALGEVRQKGGKRVQAWAFEGDADPDELESDVFELEWPPRSGRIRVFPEVDRAAWFDLARARRRLLPAQVPFLERLAELLREDGGADSGLGAAPGGR